ncbi:hypothetical protein RB195_002316 [Necator americanus]|uniref:Apple domain-containing protein n=1 Tax=Necator americanus TaxID=51031 RepID=A0ABR1DIP7_NECAM
MRWLHSTYFSIGFVMSVKLPEDVFSCFIYYPSRFLERSGTRSEGRLANVSVCLEHCMESIRIYKFVCRSAMWKRDTHLCILSVYDRTLRADKYRIALKDDIDLYENVCTSTKKAEPISFNSDWDLVRTTVPVETMWDPTPKPRPQTFPRKRQGIGQTRPNIQFELNDPTRKLLKTPNEVLAKTFSVPLSQPEIIVDAQVDGEGRSLFNLPSKAWRLPPIRRSIIERRIYTNTVTGKSPPYTITGQQTKNRAHPGTEVAQRKKVRDILHGNTATVDATRILPKASEKPAEKPCFTRYKQRILPGFEEKTFTGFDQKNCLLSCLHSETFYCASVNYNEFRKICTMNGGNLHLNQAVLKPSTSDYFENECSPERASQRKVANNTAVLLSGSVRRCFEALTDSMLLSLESKLIEGTNSLDQCKAECLKAGSSGGHLCGAFNWLPHTKGCMLFNIEFDLKLIVHHPTAQFYVNKCAANTTVTEQPKDDDSIYDDYLAHRKQH